MWAAIKELNIHVTRDKFELIDNYAISLAHQVVSNRISPRKGLSIMMQIIIKSNYSSKYTQFYDVDEDVSYLDYSGGTIFNPGLKREDIHDFIKREFQLLIDAQHLLLDKSIKDKAYCNACGQISKPKLKTRYQLTKPYSYQVMTCPNCGDTDLYDYRTQKGRERLIEESRKTQSAN